MFDAYMTPRPTLAALEALDRIDRTGSVQGAADALSVTASAISHRLKALETALGFEITTPRGRGLALTAAARAYLEEVRPALALLASAAEAAGGAAETVGPLKISAAAGFASSWLCPRLEAFRAVAPGVLITLAAGTGDGAPGPSGAADVEILFTEPQAAPADATLLQATAFFPVCAPALAHRAGGLRRAAALEGQVLLHLFDRRDWDGWARDAGAPGDLTAKARREGREIVFGDANLLFAAAEAGQGVALGDAITCSRALEEGRLVRPMSAASQSERAYHLRIAPGAPEAARRFARWLRESLAG